MSEGDTEKEYAYPRNKLAKYFCDYYKIKEDTPYEIEEIDAIKLFTVERIDLAAKYAYIKAKETGVGLEEARTLYEKHIEAFSDGLNREAGNAGKDSLETYIKVFDELIEQMKENGFDKNRSLIPVGAHNELFDGAHRVACAAYFGYKVTIVRYAHLALQYDWRFFKRRLLDGAYIDRMVLQMCHIRSDFRAVCIWPSVYGYKSMDFTRRRFMEEGIATLGCKKIQLSYEAFKKTIHYIYQEEDWIGNKLNHFKGIEDKARRCYGTGHTLAIFIIESKDNLKITELKKELREAFVLEKDSMHTTDTQEETIQLVKLFLQESYLKSLEEITLKDSLLFSVIKKGRKIRKYYANMLYHIKRFLGKPV